MKKIENVTVLIADGTMDKDEECFTSLDGVVFPPYVRISNNFEISKSLGRAKLRIEGNRLIADLEIIEDFDPTGFFPAIGGISTKKISRPEGGTVIDGAKISEVALCPNFNADSRIEKL